MDASQNRWTRPGIGGPYPEAGEGVQDDPHGRAVLLEGGRAKLDRDARHVREERRVCISRLRLVFPGFEVLEFGVWCLSLLNQPHRKL